jgi:hypothetical protein
VKLSTEVSDRQSKDVTNPDLSNLLVLVFAPLL